jgi:hypothetical protein
MTVTYRTTRAVTPLDGTPSASTRIRFRGASIQQRREVLATVLLNASLRNQEIVDYPLKSPFDVLQMDAQGALFHDKWAILDLNQ